MKTQIQQFIKIFLYKGPILILLFAVFLFYSCRESFEEDFVEAETINNPPELTGEIDTVTLTEGFDVHTVDMAAYFTDAEDDPLTFTASSSDETVVGATATGTIINLIEGEVLGIATISVAGTDGNEGNEISAEFVVEVTDVAGPTYAYGFDFNLPNGTMNDDIEWPSGATATFGGSDGSTRTIVAGASKWETTEWYYLSLTFDEPLDISANPVFQLDYADSKNHILDLQFFDASGGATELIEIRDLITDDPEFNTFTLDLSAYSDQIDLTQISEMYMEKYQDWDAGEEGTSWIIDNFYLGYEAGGGDIGPVYEFNFTLPNGTMNDDIVWPSGANATFGGSEGSTRTIEAGASKWEITEWYYLSLTFDEPQDISANPIFQIDYAESKNHILDLQFFDASGGATELIEIRDLITEDPEFNTFSIDLSAYSDQIDLTQFSEMYMEKYQDWDAGEEGTSWIIDNFIIGPNN